MKSDFDSFSDITVEIFNNCFGSCTGCMLTPEERRFPFVLNTPDEFLDIARALKKHGNEIGTTFRPVFSFGDIPLLSVEIQRKYYDICFEESMPFGITVTFTKDADSHYENVMTIISEFNDTIIDFTFDPFRFKKNNNYRSRIKRFLPLFNKRHIQVLLSEPVLDNIEPRELEDMLLNINDNEVCALVFIPTQKNMITSKNYNYHIDRAINYAREFYNLSTVTRSFFEMEMRRFSIRYESSYSDFIVSNFHVGPHKKVYCVVFTPYGDFILDERNNASEIGVISGCNLSEILKSPASKIISTKNLIFMNSGDYGCSDCEWFNSCNFYGVGIARAYNKSEFKIGPCYGPISIYNDIKPLY